MGGKILLTGGGLNYAGDGRIEVGAKRMMDGESFRRRVCLEMVETCVLR